MPNLLDSSKQITWTLRPGETLPDRIRQRVKPSQVLLQWVCHGLAVAAAVTGRPWLYCVGGITFLLQWGGGLKGRRYGVETFATIPELTVADAYATGPLPSVAVIVAARNEEVAIERAATSLARLEYLHFQVLIVDDHSTDRTGAILDRLADRYTTLHVFHNPPPTEGWLGKANALRNALGHVDPSAEWLLFTDADVIFDPVSLRAAMAYAEREKLDFLTLLPRLTTGTVTERLLLPLMWRSIACVVPHQHLNDEGAIPIGVGAFILVKRALYEASGGHAVHAGEHCDDTLLAAVIKNAGGKMGFTTAPTLLSIRLFHGTAHAMRGLAFKTRVYARDSLLAILGAMSSGALSYLLPLPLSIWAMGTQIVTGQFAFSPSLYVALGLLAYVGKSRAHRGVHDISDVPDWMGWLHPIGGLLRLPVLLVALIQNLLGRNVRWRGRVEIKPTL